MIMTDAEVKEEAQRRLSAMSEREKLDMFRLSKKEEQFLTQVGNDGMNSLDKKQTRRFVKLMKKMAFRSCAGGIKMALFVENLEREFKITKDDLRKGKVRNPFKPEMARDAVTIIVMIVIGYILLHFTNIPREDVTVGSACLIVGIELIKEYKKHRKLRKINKKYMSGSMDEPEVRAAMMQSVLAESTNKCNY